MNLSRPFLAGLAFALISIPGLSAPRTVAITVDDLPYAAGRPLSTDVALEAVTAESINRKLLAAFRHRRVPVTGFVIGDRARFLAAAGPRILARWTSDGFDLGNHTWSHPDINDLSVDQIRDEILRVEPAIGPLMKNAPPAFFRFPMNHTGETKAKHDAIAEFLSLRGYAVAASTIDTSDYVFNEAYVRMLAKKDPASARRLRAAYLAYTDSEIDYYSRLNTQVFGYEPPEVMLLHDNQLNADVIQRLLQLFVGKHYRFVSLSAAQADPAYRTPDTYITKFGPMWGYRWAAERQVKVDGRLEPDPPKWISDYGR